MLRTAVAGMIALCAAASAVPAGTIDPAFTFRTIETVHFSVHYHQGLEGLARKTVAIAEEVHPALTKEFLWEPAERTQIVLVDDTDFTNGFATVLPYNLIYIQTVPPSPDSTIGEYDDWLRMILIHEYAHILAMDAARGYSRTTRAVFGKPLPAASPFSLVAFVATAPPNIFLPRWWHEGVATWAETEHTSAGRGRSTWYGMIFRSAVNDRNLPSIDQINGDVPYWPAGSMPYIFGLRFGQYLAEKYGRKTPGALSLEHAGRFPYFLNGAPARLLGGRDYVTLYVEMLNELVAVEKKQLSLLAATPFTPVRPFPAQGERLSNPRFSPDGKLVAYARRDPHGHETFVIADRGTGRIRRTVRRTYADRSVTWRRDSGGVYFSQSAVVNGFSLYQDIFHYDLATGETTRLTEGGRLGEPDLSPDGSLFAAVRSFRGSQSLVTLAVPAQLKKRLALTTLDGGDGGRIQGPRWSPDGRLIAYVRTDEGGATSLRVYDVTAGTWRVLVEGVRYISSPAWSPDGRHVLYVADENGVFNVYTCAVADGVRTAVTHTAGGFLQPDIAPDGGDIIVARYHSRGTSLGLIPFDRAQWPSLPLPSIAAYGQAKSDAVPAVAVPSASVPAKNADSPYSPLQTLAPRFWLPTLSADSEGLVLGAFTGGQDALGRHTYAAEFDFGLSSGETYYSVQYRNDRFYPTVVMKTHELPVLYADLLRPGDYWEFDRAASIELRLPVNRVESRHLFSLGYEFRTVGIQAADALSRPGAPPLFKGNLNSLFAGYAYDGSLRYPWSISREEGRSFSFLYRYRAPDIGSDIEGTEYTASYREFILPAPEKLPHHVLYLNLNGGVASGDRTLQQAFQIGGIPNELALFPLRGYPARFETGTYALTGTVEYRMPVRPMLSGAGTTPLFFEKIHSAVFVDSGAVWDDSRGFSSDIVKTGIGGELRLDVTLGYWAKVTPALGIARGLDDGGETSIYFTIYANF